MNQEPNYYAVIPKVESLSGFDLAKRKRKSEAYQTRKHYADNKSCVECGITPGDPVNRSGYYPSVHGMNTVHHLVPIKNGGTWKDGLITLCDECHRKIHTVDGRFSWHHVNEEMTQKYLKSLQKELP